MTVPASPRYRGIVVVHGVGSQRPGEQLDAVVEPLVDFLGRALGRAHVSLVSRTPPGEDRVGEAEIHLRDGSTLTEIWHVREAWWAQSFRPSATSAVLVWMLTAIAFHVYSSLVNGLIRPIARAFQREPAANFWLPPISGWPFAFIVYPINWFLINTGEFLAYVLGLIAATLLAIVLQVPGAGYIPALGGILRALSNWISGGIGDQQAMTTRSVPIAAAASTVATALEPFLSPGAQAPAYETVTVIAHSGGCVVSFAALSGDMVAHWLHGPAGEGPLRRVNWFTVGSGLDIAWRMRARQHEAVKAFWHKRLDHFVNWFDMFARYDPVPDGEAPEDMVEALMGPAPRASYRSVRVANDDWPFSDHGAYWWNLPEAMSRFVWVIASGEPNSGQPYSALLRAAEKARGKALWRRRSVGLIRLCALVFVVVGIIVVFGFDAFWLIVALFGLCVPAIGILLVMLASAARRRLREFSGTATAIAIGALVVGGAALLTAGGPAWQTASDFWHRAPIAAYGRGESSLPLLSAIINLVKANLPLTVDVLGWKIMLTDVHDWLSGTIAVLLVGLLVLIVLRMILSLWQWAKRDTDDLKA